MLEQIHQNAITLATRYREVEADLIEVLQLAGRHKVYRARGHASLFRYAIDELGLGDNIAYAMIAVARKSREVPALLTAMRSRRLTLSKARRVTVVLTKENSEEWLEKACALSSRALEREIARVRPQDAVKERTTYVAEKRVKLEVGLSEDEVLALRRVQDLLCKKLGRAVTLEEVIATMSQEYLERHDPVARAKRHRVRTGAPTQERKAPAKLGTLRVPIPAPILHQVNWRDQGRCTEILPNGQRCNESRWTEVHHIKPVAEGGGHSLENLTTLCSGHHDRIHAMISVG